MDWKDFFKLSKVKIAIFIFLTLATLFFYAMTNMLGGCLADQPCVTPLTAILGEIGLWIFALPINLYSLLEINLMICLILVPIYWYLLSCISTFIYNKHKK
jgi:hypothetical protein